MERACAPATLGSRIGPRAVAGGESGNPASEVGIWVGDKRFSGLSSVRSDTISGSLGSSRGERFAGSKPVRAPGADTPSRRRSSAELRSRPSASMTLGAQTLSAPPVFGRDRGDCRDGFGLIGSSFDCMPPEGIAPLTGSDLVRERPRRGIRRTAALRHRAPRKRSSVKLPVSRLFAAAGDFGGGCPLAAWTFPERLGHEGSESKGYRRSSARERTEATQPGVRPDRQAGGRSAVLARNPPPG